LDPENCQATPAKGTTCFRSFSIGNDLFTTLFTAQMGRGKIQLEAFTSRSWNTDFTHFQGKNTP
jgi:hypothetical protein